MCETIVLGIKTHKDKNPFKNQIAIIINSQVTQHSGSVLKVNKLKVIRDKSGQIAALNRE